MTFSLEFRKFKLLVEIYWGRRYCIETNSFEMVWERDGSFFWPNGDIKTWFAAWKSPRERVIGEGVLGG